MSVCPDLSEKKADTRNMNPVSGMRQREREVGFLTPEQGVMSVLCGLERIGGALIPERTNSTSRTLEREKSYS